MHIIDDSLVLEMLPVLPHVVRPSDISRPRLASLTASRRNSIQPQLPTPVSDCPARTASSATSAPETVSLTRSPGTQLRFGDGDGDGLGGARVHSLRTRAAGRWQMRSPLSYWADQQLATAAQYLRVSCHRHIAAERGRMIVLPSVRSVSGCRPSVLGCRAPRRAPHHTQRKTCLGDMSSTLEDASKVADVRGARMRLELRTTIGSGSEASLQLRLRQERARVHCGQRRYGCIHPAWHYRRRQRSRYIRPLVVLARKLRASGLVWKFH
ncbi:hypothetical protein C8Q70DRAFT_157822 [Cubamyces menziesii]|nr:hypothetical protein C8Q70DRAFT_157822 [Cubamyces menziesii]